MSPRYLSKSARVSVKSADPWRAEASPGGSENNGGWVLSYLDVMTILFTFFVLLFAYQKAMTPPLAKPHKPVATVQTKLQQAKPNPAASGKPAMFSGYATSTQQAVATMKSQAMAGAHGISDGLPLAESTSNERQISGLTDKALTAAAQLASEQTARLMEKALAQETERRQVEIIQEERQVRVEVSDAILFAPGSADLSSEGYALLDRLNAILATRKDTLFVEGHTDPTPIANSRFPSNWELSSARASAVTRYLILKGLPAERLRAIGLADTRPLADNGTAEGRTRNRRVTLVMGDYAS